LSKPARPSIGEITLVLSHIADRVADDPSPRLDPILGSSLRRALEELQRFVPGLDAAPDPEAARFFRRAAEAAFHDGLHRDALARALRGLSFAPHDPNLHYLAASACFEMGAVHEAVLLLSHALWIHPGHPEARRDLLTFAAPDDATAWGAAAPPPEGDSLEGWEDMSAQSELRFEMLDANEGPNPELNDPERRDAKAAGRAKPAKSAKPEGEKKEPKTGRRKRRGTGNGEGEGRRAA
jgi:hypothetical protein